MRIAFEHNAVFECAGLTFIRVANDVFLLALRHADELPLASGGEARTAASLQSGFLDGLDDLFGSQLAQRFAESLISVFSNKFFDILRVDSTCAFQDDALLSRVVSFVSA